MRSPWVRVGPDPSDGRKADKQMHRESGHVTEAETGAKGHS